MSLSLKISHSRFNLTKWLVEAKTYMAFLVIGNMRRKATGCFLKFYLTLKGVG